MDTRPYHEQLTHDEFRALMNPLVVERMPHRLYHWGLVQYGIVPDGKFMRPGWEATEDGVEVRKRAEGRFQLAPRIEFIDPVENVPHPACRGTPACDCPDHRRRF